MESEQVSRTIELIRRHGKVAVGCIEQSYSQWAAYAQAGQFVLGERVTEFVAEHRGGVLLVSYSADSTPLSAKGSINVGSGSKKPRAHGKGSYDLLVQQVSVSAILAPDRVKSVTSISCPALIGYGKSMEAMAALFWGCSSLGSAMASAQQITIRHQVHDAGLTAGLRDCGSGWWFTNCVAPIIEKESTGDTDYTELFALWEWHVSVDCALHPTHNSLRWALPEIYVAREVMTEAYVCMQSGKQCYLGLLASVESWLSEVLYPCDVGELPSAEELEELWVTLGCDAQTVELLVKMRVIFRINENRLMVLREVIASDSFVSDITRALLVCWKIDAYTESRWLTFGKAGRSYTRAHLLGYGSIMEHAKEKRTVSMYQAGGYDRKSLSVALLFTLLRTCSRSWPPSRRRFWQDCSKIIGLPSTRRRHCLL
eukprot:3117274-Amphidinium_carterae.2